jgi:hypothetical protein
MSSEVFLLRVILSFVIGGLYIAVMARITERFGSKLGGLLIALPGTAFVGLAFIAWVQGPAAVSEATAVMPATLAASTIFLVVFSLLYRYGMLTAYFSAVIVWFSLNLPVVIFKLHSLGIALLIATVLFSISISFFHHEPHRLLKPSKGSKKTLAIRAVFAGSFVAIAVICSKLFGPIWGGLFASFPAAFSAVILIFGRTHGREFTASTSRTMVNGVLANVVFVSSIHLSVASLGSVMSILVSYLICLLFALFSYRYIIPKI